MIKKYIERFEANKSQLISALKLKHPENYLDLVKTTLEVVNDDDYDSMNLSKIHEIDDGDYQGTLLYVIPQKCYQPSTYWAVKVSYGSCSGCDTLQSICSYSDEPPTDEQVDQYLHLALNIVQELKEI